MTAICDARLIYGRGWMSRIYMLCSFKPQLLKLSAFDWPVSSYLA